MKILKDLFYGELYLADRNVNSSRKKSELAKLVCKKEERLINALNDEQIKMFESFCETKCMLQGEYDCDTFIKGFALALRIAIECFNEDFT